MKPSVELPRFSGRFISFDSVGYMVDSAGGLLEVYGREISECQVSPMGVVPALDVLKYGHPGFGLCAVASAIQAFAFERGKKRFTHCVVTAP